MSRVTLCVVLLASSLAAGCAGNRTTTADSATATAVPASTEASSATAADPAAAAAYAAAAADSPAAAPPSTPTPAPTVVDGNALAQRSADTLLCRDLLVYGSNMIRRTCGTAAQWKVYGRREAELAADTVRRMQNGRVVSRRR